MDRSTSRKKLNLLQGFRGIASSLVILVHGATLLQQQTNQIAFGGLFSFGYTGVDFFFVLSGFIIYYIHHRDIGQSKKFRNFLSKRFWRVYPLYWLVLLPRLFRPGSSIDGWTILSSFALFPYPSPPLVNVSWTLTYEIFFYLIFSLLIWRPSKLLWGLLGSWLALDAGYWILRFFSIIHTVIDQPVLQFFFSPFHLEFIFGCAAAYGVLNYRWKRSKLLMWSGIVLFVSCGMLDNWLHHLDTINQQIPFLTTYDPNYSTFTGRYSMLFFGLPSMLIVLGAAAWELVEDITLPKWFTYLGDASFSVYLIHGTVINNVLILVAKYNQQSWLTNFWIQISILALSLGVGCLFHEWAEKPLLKLVQKQFLTPKQTA